MDDGKTRVLDLELGAWAVYRVTTRSGTGYLVGLHSVGGRRSAIVRGAPGTEREDLVVADTDPRIGERSLFDVPAREWVGAPLRVATLETSAVASVEQTGDTREVAAVTTAIVPRSGASQRASPPPERAAQPEYPESFVRYAEDAAMLLRTVERRAALLFADVEREPSLRARLQVALLGCALALEQLGVRR